MKVKTRAGEPVNVGGVLLGPDGVWYRVEDITSTSVFVTPKDSPGKLRKMKFSDFGLQAADPAKTKETFDLARKKLYEYWQN